MNLNPEQGDPIPGVGELAAVVLASEPRGFLDLSCNSLPYQITATIFPYAAQTWLLLQTCFLSLPGQCGPRLQQASCGLPVLAPPQQTEVPDRAGQQPLPHSRAPPGSQLSPPKGQQKEHRAGQGLVSVTSFHLSPPDWKTQH